MAVVVNPTAGRGKAGRLIGKVDRLLHETGVGHAVELAESGPDLEERARRAAAEGARVVAVLGGDGTAGLAANGILGSGASLAIVPSGTADDFASSMGVRSVDQAVRAIAAGVTATIDVDPRHGRRHGPALRQRGRVRVRLGGQRGRERHAVDLGATGTYVVAVVKTLSRFSPATFRIELDDRVIEGPHMLVVVGNAISYGGGMRVTPDASVVDGVADVCVLRALSKPAFLRAFPRVFRGTHVRHPAVGMHRSARVGVEADRRVTVYADGERVGPAAGHLRGPAGRAPRGGGPQREGGAVSEGLLLLHAFPVDARMWEAQLLGPRTIDARPARLRRVADPRQAA